jgi:hypothetical protein
MTVAIKEGMMNGTMRVTLSERYQLAKQRHDENIRREKDALKRVHAIKCERHPRCHGDPWAPVERVCPACAASWQILYQLAAARAALRVSGPYLQRVKRRMSAVVSP